MNKATHWIVGAASAIVSLCLYAQTPAPANPAASTPEKTGSPASVADAKNPLQPRAGPAPDALTVLDVSGTGALAFTASTSEFRRRLILNLAPRKERALLKVKAGLLERRDAVDTVLTVTADPSTGNSAGSSLEIGIEPLQQSVEILIGAKFSEQGDYASYLMLQLDSSPAQFKPIKITYAQPDLPVEAGALHWANDKLAFQLSGPTDRTLSVGAVVYELHLMRSPSEKVQADYGTTRFTVIDEKAPKQNEWKFWKEAAAAADGTSMATLVHGAPVSMGLAVDELSAGSYSGKVRLTAAGYKPKDESVSFVVRGPWYVAFLLIVLGAGISAAIQHYATYRQPRLLVRELVARILSDADEMERRLSLDADEASLLQQLRERAQSKDDESHLSKLPVAWSTDTQTKLRAVEERLALFPAWVNARRALADVSVPAAKRVEFQASLEASRSAFESDGPLTDEQKASLKALQNKVEGARREAMAEPLKALSAQIDVGDQETAQVGAKEAFARARAAITDAQRLLALGQYDAYRTRFDEAGLEYSRGKGLDLEADIPSGATGLWDAVRKLLARLDASRDRQSAEVLYQQAYDAFERANSVAIEQDLTALKGALGGQVVADVLASTQAHVRAGSGLELSTDGGLRAMLEGRNAALEILGPGKLDVVAASRMPERAPATPELPSRPSAERIKYVQEKRTGSRRAGKEARVFDIVLEVFAVLVAGLLGVVLVWFPDSDWGQTYDWFAALLWGLGLHTIGNSTFMGIAAVKAKLQTPTTSS